VHGPPACLQDQAPQPVRAHPCPCTPVCALLSIPAVCRHLSVASLPRRHRHCGALAARVVSVPAPDPAFYARRPRWSAAARTSLMHLFDCFVSAVLQRRSHEPPPNHLPTTVQPPHNLGPAPGPRTPLCWTRRRSWTTTTCTSPTCPSSEMARSTTRGTVTSGPWTACACTWRCAGVRGGGVCEGGAQGPSWHACMRGRAPAALHVVGGGGAMLEA